MNIDKIMKYHILLEDEHLSEKERTSIQIKLYKEMNRGDFSFQLAIGLAYFSPLLLLLLLK